MNSNARLMLAFALCGLIYFVFEIWLRPPLPPPDASDPVVGVEATLDAAKAPRVDPALSTEPSAPVEPVAPPTKSDVDVISHRVASDLLALTLTNRTPHDGGLVQTIELLSPQFEGHDTATDSVGLAGRPTLEVSFADEATDFRLPRGEVFEVESKTPTSFTIARRAEGVEIRERVELTGGYGGKLTVEVRNTASRPARHRLKLRVRVGVGDSRYDIRRGVCRTAEGVEDEDNSDVEDGPLSYTGDIAWIGADSKYFTTLLVPASPAETCTIDLEKNAAKPEDPGVLVVSLASAVVEVPVGGSQTHEFGLYVGAKELERLEAYTGVGADSVDLEESIDWGVFGGLSKILGKFLLLLLRWFHGLVHNWGAAILLLTVLVKVFTLPLTLKQMSSMKRMKEIQPEIAKIKEKYGDDRQKQGQEMQALFSRSGVNPMASCLPMVVQLPIWFALYSMLLTAVELVHEPFLWLPDLTQQDPIFALPLALGAMMVLQNRMMPNTMDEAQAKLMRYFMPAIFTVFMLFLPSGLGVYIFTNIVLSVIQTFVQLRTGNNDAEPAPAKA